MKMPAADDILPAPRGRFVALDALRALALFGVIVMNVPAVTMIVAAPEIMAAAGPVDFGVAAFSVLLIQGKARACFAFLFGVGFGMLLERAGKDADRAHLRRMAALLAFGLVNQFFLFFGDILSHYAILGALLPLARRWPDRRLLQAGAILIIVPPLLFTLVTVAIGAPVPSLNPAGARALVADGHGAYTSGSYFDVVAHNLTFQARSYAADTAHRIEYDLALLGLFLLGLVAARRRLLIEPHRHARLLRRIAAWCLPTGFLVGGLYVVRPFGLLPAGLETLAAAGFAGLPVMAFGMMAAALLWFSHGAQRLQAVLAPAGRMSLTNYLLSGAIATATFCGFGLGLIGKLNIAAMTAFALALCVLLTLFSHFWLARFRLGPAEWLWRSIGNGRVERPSRIVPATAKSDIASA